MFCVLLTVVVRTILYCIGPLNRKSMRKTKDLKPFFGKNVEAARFIGVTRGAYSNWADLIPEISARRYHSRTRDPDYMQEFFGDEWKEKGVLTFDPNRYGQPA